MTLQEVLVYFSKLRGFKIIYDKGNKMARVDYIPQRQKEKLHKMFVTYIKEAEVNIQFECYTTDGDKPLNASNKVFEFGVKKESCTEHYLNRVVASLLKQHMGANPRMIVNLYNKEVSTWELLNDLVDGKENVIITLSPHHRTSERKAIIDWKTRNLARRKVTISYENEEIVDHIVKEQTQSAYKTYVEKMQLGGVVCH